MFFVALGINEHFKLGVLMGKSSNLRNVEQAMFDYERGLWHWVYHIVEFWAAC